MKKLLAIVLAIVLAALANGQAADETSPANAVTKPTAVHIEYKWSDWTTNNLSTNQIAEYMALFKTAVEKSGMKVVEAKDTPTVTSTLDLMGGFTFVGGGHAESHVTYKLSFLCTDSEGKQVFTKAYKGEVKGGDARIESEGMVFMGCNVKLDDVKQAIAKKLESEPINKPQEQEVPVVKSVALTSAAYAGNLAEVKRLVETGSDVNGTADNRVTALHLAAQRGHKQVVEYLITQKANVNAKAVFNTTPLHLAASEDRREVAEVLIANGADVNAKGLNDTTPLHNAASKGDPALVRLLVEKGADINARQSNPPNDVPIAFSAGEGHLEITEYLLSKGASVDSSNINKVTILQVASYRGHKDIVELLLAKGADVNAKNSRHTTALSLARQGGYQDIVDLLKKHGAIE